MSLSDRLNELVNEDSAVARKASALRRELRASQDRVTELEAVINAFGLIPDTHVRQPEWLGPVKRSKGPARGTLQLILSDLHLDEVVRKDQMMGINAYNRAIAVQRLRNTIRKTIMLPRTFLSGLTWDGIVVMLGGDILTGMIHEELAQTNEAPPADSVVFWCPILVECLGELADEFGKVHVPCVSGNHDRTSKRTMTKNRAQESWSWVVYHWLANAFHNDDRVTFDISPAPDLRVSVYNTTYLLTHGDQFKGGGGITGPVLPWMRGEAKKRGALDAAEQMLGGIDLSYDILVMGHWHSYATLPNILVNGSLKGYDEFARDHSFRPEVPTQALWVTSPENGACFHLPVYPMDREKEDWDF